MAYINDADVQIHLPVDSLKVEEIPDDRAIAFEDAERIVRGYLGGVVDSDVLITWDTPENTPDQIRAVAGRLAAAKIYRLRFGQSSMRDPEYAQNLYDEAIAMLQGIIAGTIIVDGVDVGSDFDNTWFEPNNASLAPFFAMGDQY